MSRPSPPPVPPGHATNDPATDARRAQPGRESGRQRAESGDVRGALEAVTAAAAHLRWRIAATTAVGPDELECAVLADDPDAVAVAVAATARGRGSDDAQVLASLWWQAYAYRVAGTALACWLIGGVAPDVRADRMGVGIARSRPSSVVYLAPTSASVAGVADLATFVDHLFAGHLDAVAASLRARHALGAQLVWGNVAAACASGVGAVHQAAGPDWPDRLAAFLAAAPHGLGALGRWAFPAGGPDFRRRTCCLWWKTTAADGALCADCSLRDRPTPSSDDPAPTPGSSPSA